MPFENPFLMVHLFQLPYRMIHSEWHHHHLYSVTLLLIPFWNFFSSFSSCHFSQHPFLWKNVWTVLCGLLNLWNAHFHKLFVYFKGLKPVFITLWIFLLKVILRPLREPSQATDYGQRSICHPYATRKALRYVASHLTKLLVIVLFRA